MADKKKIKRVVSKLKEAKEKLGEEKIKNVSRPDKVKPTKGKEKGPEDSGRRRKNAPSPTAVGPRGGSFKVSATGKKIYDSSRSERVKKSMEEYFKHIEAIDNFINKFKIFKGLM